MTNYEICSDLVSEHLSDLWNSNVLEWTLPRWDAPMVSELHHYTNIAGLKGILDSGEIWATNSEFLNDTTELKHWRDIACELRVCPIRGTFGVRTT